MKSLNNQYPVLCVFPNDPIRAYFEKGEIKPRYFNPLNVFKEIHVISNTDNDVIEEKVQTIAGDAKLKIHTVGRINLTNYKKSEERVKMIVQDISPDIIRAYNPLVQGWLAARCAAYLKVPFVLSIHHNYERDGRRLFSSGGLQAYTKFQYTKRFIEPFVIQSADRVICIHKSIALYAKKYGARKIDLIYNRVYLNQFSPTVEKKFKFDRPTIINVARLVKEKNQQCLIHAIKDMDVNLLLVGDGPDFEYLNSLVKKLGCAERVKFVKSVPHSEIQHYYASADIFAAPVIDRGIGIPFLEAMASGLPTVLREHDPPEEGEMLDDAAIFVKNTPEEFRKAFERILSDSNLRQKLSSLSLKKAQEMGGEEMEKKEAGIYIDLLGQED